MNARKNDVGRPSGSNQNSRTISREEYNSVIKSIKNSKNQTNVERNKILIHFNFLLGLKAIELCELKISDVFDGKQIKERLRMSKPNKNWDLPLRDSFLKKALDRYIKSRIESEATHFSINSDLFRSQKGSFSTQALSALINKIYNESGLINVTSHTGKLSYIHNKLFHKYTVKQIFDVTGDVSIKNTQRYVNALKR